MHRCSLPSGVGYLLFYFLLAFQPQADPHLDGVGSLLLGTCVLLTVVLHFQYFKATFMVYSSFAGAYAAVGAGSSLLTSDLLQSRQSSAAAAGAFGRGPGPGGPASAWQRVAKPGRGRRRLQSHWSGVRLEQLTVTVWGGVSPPPPPARPPSAVLPLPLG